MRPMYRITFISVLIVLNFFVGRYSAILGESDSQNELDLEDAKKFFLEHPEYLSDGFDFPVGKPNAKGYIDKQPFGKNFHLGEDWNAAGRNEFPV